ncbi:FixH family protein [Kangiella koreensis]|uniref:FixH family protein n=1 Tax=Kangiella koreensis (strain DSM 16069 / JCM 12317 / KCTC 12182 / SW-125) TaxID=523791 RepID=C7R8U6_KANKD|nr:FixH family protein [Kangiella koreensis]ACV25959.1 FixH family protein [Kangiella koreensis DSM 16069]
MNQVQEQDTKPWYKQFWPWFVIAIPASSVVTGILLVTIAVNNPASMVKDDYYKQGLAINQVLEKRQLAKEMGIRADIDLTGQRLEIRLASNQPIGDSLFLDFRHATLEERDFSLALKQNANGVYFAELTNDGSEKDTQGKWHVTLRPYGDEWELEQIWTLPTKRELTLGY